MEFCQARCQAPAVSVIVPLYRCERFMERSIQSVLRQSLTNIEILLVDDGSPDESGRMAEAYAAQDSRIFVIHQQHGGPGMARNAGIRKARGEYLGFVDSDDIASPEMFQSLYEAARHHKAAMAICAYYEESWGGREAVCHNIGHGESLSRDQIHLRILPTFVQDQNLGHYCLWNKLYLRSWLIEEQILLEEDRDHGEDWWFNLQLIARCPLMVGLRQPLYRYIHQNPGSLTTRYRENGFELYLRGHRQQHRFLLEHSLPIDQSILARRFLAQTFRFARETMAQYHATKACRKRIEGILTHEEVSSCICQVKAGPLHIQWLCCCLRAKRMDLVWISLLIFWKLDSLGRFLGRSNRRPVASS